MAHIETERKVCVVLYSRRHFDPAKKTDLSESSAGQIAKSIYNSIKSLEKTTVYYFDSFEHHEWSRIETDILITLIDNMPLAEWFFKPKQIIVIAVNQHPMTRFLNVAKSISSGMKFSAIAASDGPYQPYLCLSRANAILCVGNVRTVETYRHYLQNCNIQISNYKSSFSNSNIIERPRKIRNILILMSSIGFRKGFDRFQEAVERESAELKRYQFHLVGHPEGMVWKDNVDRLVSGNTFVANHGWILNNSSQFRTVISEIDVAIFPTREEGLVGSLLECLDSGIICLHTSNSGLNNTRPELSLPDQGDLNLGEILRNLGEKTEAELQSLYEFQLKEMREQFHDSAEIGAQVATIIENGLPPAISKFNWPVALNDFLNALHLKNWPLLKARIQLIQMRILLAKFEITYPVLYRTTKKIYKMF